MAVFRPMNSDESNLFTIRLNVPRLDNLNTSQNGNILDTTYTSPTINNLPDGFSIQYDSSNGYITVNYGKIFVTEPAVNINIFKDASVYNSNIISITNQYLIFTITTASPTSGNIVNGDLNNTSWIPSFSMIITGPITMGLSTGLLNSGWQIEQRSNPTKTYTKMNLGIGNNSVNSKLDIIDTNTINNAVSINSDSLTSGSALHISSDSNSNLQKNLINLEAENQSNTSVLTLDGSSKYNLLVKGNVIIGKDVTDKIDIPKKVCYFPYTDINNELSIDCNSSHGQIILTDNEIITQSTPKKIRINNNVCNENSTILLTLLQKSTGVINVKLASQDNTGFNLELLNLLSSDYNTGNNETRINFMIINA